MGAIAIDFGTSNTVVCRWDPVTGEAITWMLPGLGREFSQGSQGVGVVPSLVFVGGPEQVVIGEGVRRQRLAERNPERFFQGFKRDLLTAYGPPPRLLDGESYDAQRVATLFLDQLVQSLRETGIPMTQVILTVPVGASQGYQQWLAKTAQGWGLGGVQLLDEATAAALSYALAEPGSLILVLDFGGGTLDVSLVRLPEVGQAVQVIARTDAYVGGLDIDVWIGEELLRRWGLARSGLTALAWQMLLEVAERVKIQLSEQQGVKDTWFDEQGFMAYEVSLTREELGQILEGNGFLDQIRQCLDEVIQAASYQGIRRAQIDQVILVGGTSQMPAVQGLIQSQFGRGKVRGERPFTAVAEGALLLSRQVRVQTTLRQSYALRLWDPDRGGPLYVPLFDQGTAYPCDWGAALVVQVANPGQRQIRLEVGTLASTSQAEVIYDEQGRMSSRRVVQPQDFRPLVSEVIAYLDPPGEVGQDRLQLSFRVDEQGLLRVRLVDLLSQTVLVEEGIMGYLE